MISVIICIDIRQTTIKPRKASTTLWCGVGGAVHPRTKILEFSSWKCYILFLVHFMHF